MYRIKHVLLQNLSENTLQLYWNSTHFEKIGVIQFNLQDKVNSVKNTTMNIWLSSVFDSFLDIRVIYNMHKPRVDVATSTCGLCILYEERCQNLMMDVIGRNI